MVHSVANAPRQHRVDHHPALSTGLNCRLARRSTNAKLARLVVGNRPSAAQRWIGIDGFHNIGIID
jgi:hypothetical protein